MWYYSPIQSRFGNKGLGGSPGEMTNEPSRCTSSTSRLVRAIDVTNKNKLCVKGLSVLGLNSGLICVLLVMSSITLPIASAMADELCARHRNLVSAEVQRLVFA